MATELASALAILTAAAPVAGADRLRKVRSGSDIRTLSQKVEVSWRVIFVKFERWQSRAVEAATTGAPTDCARF
jgi:hypothetical protein